MRIFGITISREKAAPGQPQAVDTARGWWPIVREAFAGAWQRNKEPVTLETAASNPVLFRCVSLIAGDIAKMRCRLMEQTRDSIWEETDSPSFSPVLRKPNHYQNRIQFFASWMISKLTTGNALVLKERDGKSNVVKLHVLDWSRVTVLVAPDGSVFYDMKADHLAGLPEGRVAVPASEVIHDRWNTLFHPLVGLSPIYACGLAALQAQEIQGNSTKFFRNGSRPGGILTAPKHIDDDTAKRLKEHWEKNYTADNMGKVAVLGDGLKYEAMAISAHDAQLIDQLKWAGETICGCFGVPPYMAAVGPAPLNNNVQSLNELYYSQCLQIHIESIETCLDDGLGIGYGVKTNGKVYGTEFDLDDLLRMDSATLIKTLAEGVKGGIFTPNEARRRVNRPKVKGGDVVYLQQQNFSLEALSKRDAKDDPFATSSDGGSLAPIGAANDDQADELEAAKALIAIQKGLRHVRR